MQPSPPAGVQPVRPSARLNGGFQLDLPSGGGLNWDDCLDQMQGRHSWVGFCQRHQAWVRLVETAGFRSVLFWSIASAI